MFNLAVRIIGIAAILLSMVGRADAYYSETVGSYSASNTNSAHQETWDAYLGWFPAGTTVRIGTCEADGDLPGASYSGDTFLRLFRWNGLDLVEIAANDDNVGDCGFRGSYLAYTLPYSMDLEIRAGCYSSTLCSGTIVVNVDMDSNGSLSNVVHSFQRLANWTKSVRLWWYNSSLMPGHFTKPIFGDGRDHFQGMARLRSWGPGYYHGGWFALSGSGEADLFFIFLKQTSTEPNIDPKSSISAIQSPADANNSAVRIHRTATAPIDGGTATHYGGLQAFGRYLAVGLERGDKSEIHFWEVNDPYAPGFFDFWLGRSIGAQTGGAAAVGITKAPGLRKEYIMAVAGRDSNRIDFYRNPVNSYGYANPRDTDNWLYICGVTQSHNAPFENYFQNINLVYQDDGKLFLIGTRNNGTGVESSGNRARLYELTWNGNCYDFVLQATNTFGSYRNTCAAFNGGLGVYVEADTDRLAIYGTHGYRPDASSGTLPMVEFWK